MGVRGKLRIASDGPMWWCPACESYHPAGRWQFNGDYENPTFSPSFQVRTGHYADGNKDECYCNWAERFPNEEPLSACMRCAICHTFVRNGKIEYLADSTHEYAGKTVDLPTPTKWLEDDTPRS